MFETDITHSNGFIITWSANWNSGADPYFGGEGASAYSVSSVPSATWIFSEDSVVWHLSGDSPYNDSGDMIVTVKKAP
jgi:hypothetical protein